MWLKPTRYHRAEVPHAVLPSSQRVLRLSRRLPFCLPLRTQILLKSHLRALCAQRCARERPQMRKSGPLGGQGCQKVRKWSPNADKWEQKMCLKSKFQKKVPKVVWTHYLPYIITLGTLRKPHFLAPGRSENARLFRVVPRMPPRGCKMAPTGPKNGESGVPRHPQGCQRVSQCPLKCSKKTSKISTPAPRVPRVPHRPQNTSILDVPPTGVTPCRGNVRRFPSHSVLHPAHFLPR